MDFEKLIPLFASAIQRQENDPTGKTGIRSMPTVDPYGDLTTSIRNNYNRWSTGKQPAPWIGMRQPHPAGNTFDPTKFIDFMHRRWAPIGAENDKKDKNGEWLNSHWATGVRGILRQMLGEEEYKKWEALNLVRNNGYRNSESNTV